MPTALTDTSESLSSTPKRVRRRTSRFLTMALTTAAAATGMAFAPGGAAQAQPTCNIQNHNVIVQSGHLDVRASQNRCWATNKARLIFQRDGNLVVYDERLRPRFASNTVNRGFRMIFQSDGNLVIYSRFGTSPRNAVFSTRTQGHPNDFLAVQTDGNVVIYSCEGRVLFATNTRH